MAYQDITAPAQVLNREIQLTRSFVVAITAPITRFFADSSYARSAQNRFARIEALRAMSDEELAKRGTRRDDIVNHVMRDLFIV